MLSEIMNDEVAKQRKSAKSVAERKTNFRGKSVEPHEQEQPKEDEQLNLLKYRSMLQDTEDKFKKATNDKIATSLFAGDKFFNMKKSSNEG